MTLFLGASRLQFLVSFKVKAENRENAAGEHGVSAGGEPQNTKKSKFLGMLLTGVGLPSQCTESLFANYT